MELFGEKLIRGSVHPYIGQEAIAVGVCDALRDGRLHHQHAPRPRPLHRQGPRPAADDGRDHRPRDRLLPRQGRLHAHHRHAPRDARRRRHRRRLAGHRRRRGARPAAAGRGRRGRRVLRRRRLEPGHLPRGRQPRRDPQGARRSSCARTTSGRSRRRSSAPWRCPTSPLRAQGYGFPGVVVDGNDVLAVRAVAETAVARARAGEGPTLIEAKTYRDHGRTPPPRRRTRAPRSSIRHWRGARPDPDAWRRSCGTSTASTPRTWRRSTRPPRPRSRRPSRSRWRRRHPTPPQALEDVYAPAAWHAAGEAVVSAAAAGRDEAVAS